jgi:hypothetical protein
MVPRDRGVLTIAYGSDRYLEMAKSLARSLQLHSPQVPRAVVTDSADDAELKRLFDVCIPLNRELGSGFQQKLYLDKYTPFGRTLFLDSDSLVVTDVDAIWRYFEGVHFGIPGSVRLKRGDVDPNMDVDYILNQFDLLDVPKFNSGLICFESCAAPVFDTARGLLARHRELRFSNGDNPFDEPILAVAMALHGISLVQEDERTMRTPAGLRGNLTIDVAQGVARFNKHGTVVRPGIVHFAGPFAASFQYRRECYKLRTGYKGTLRQRLAIIGLALNASQASSIQRRSLVRSRAASIKRRMRAVSQFFSRKPPATAIRP